MQLQTIEINGFKTFAERTKIIVPSGITMVIGPNGSGKSNIIDAIRWAMGEQSIHSLRAASPQELIFNGGATNPPHQMAEVSLTFDNSDKSISLDSSQVVLTRRIYRSNEQEYLINNTVSKLKDIRALFYGTGIGKGFYSVLEQGKTDSLLSKKMEDRRVVFEEIAGIRNYRVQYLEAERKLLASMEKTAKLQPLLEELKSRYTVLQKQTKEAEHYRQLHQNLRHAQMQRDLAHYLNSKEMLNEATLKLAASKGRRADIQKERSELLANQHNIGKEIEKSSESLSQMRGELHANTIEKERTANHIRTLEQQQQSIEEYISQEGGALERDQNKIAHLRGEQKSEEESLERAQTQLREVEESLKSASAHIQQIVSYTQKRSNDVAACHTKLADIEKKRKDMWSNIRELSARVVETLEQQIHPHRDIGIAYRQLTQEIHQLLGQINTRLTQQLKSLTHTGQMGMHDAAIATKVAREYSAMTQRLQHECQQLTHKIETHHNTIDPLMNILTNPKGDFNHYHLLGKEYQHLGQQVDAVQQEIQQIDAEIDKNRASLASLQEEKAQLQLLQERHKNSVSIHAKNCHRILNEIDELTQARNQIHDRIVSYRLKKNECGQKSRQAQHQISQLKKKDSAINDAILSVQKKIEQYRTSLARIHRRINDKDSTLTNRNLQVEKATQLYHTHEVRIEEIKKNFLDQYAQEIEDYQQNTTINANTIDTSRTNASRIAAIKKELESLGKVNLMAPVEFEEVEGRYKLLNAQVEDLNNASADLKTVTARILHESGTLLRHTIEEINRHFRAVFHDMFRGGKAKIFLSNADSPLSSDINIEVHPPGKNLVRIEQLSGGERSLSALSLLFALFRHRPSPVALMDEVDATLDDTNIDIFANHLLNYKDTTQFIIISHSPKAVMSAETLIGVTMQEQGISTVVELDIAQYRKS